MPTAAAGFNSDALVQAAGTVLAALVTGLFGIQWGRKRGQAEKQKEAEEAAKSVGGGAAKGVAYAVDEHLTYVEFNEDGDGSNKRNFVGINADRALDNLTIPFSFSLAAPGSRLGAPTVDPLPESKLPVSFVGQEFGDHLVRGAVQIIGLLAPGSTAGFSLIHPFT